MIAPRGPGAVNEDVNETIRDTHERLTFKAHAKIASNTAASLAVRTPISETTGNRR